jgi:hypothetical protein
MDINPPFAASFSCFRHKSATVLPSNSGGKPLSVSAATAANYEERLTMLKVHHTELDDSAACSAHSLVMVSWYVMVDCPCACPPSLLAERGLGGEVNSKCSITYFATTTHSLHYAFILSLCELCVLCLASL